MKDRKKESLFEYISSAVADGELPADFSLPKSEDEQGILSWADGAKDGVSLYHSVTPVIGTDERKLMSDALRAADSRDYDLADCLFSMLGRHVRAVFGIDPLQNYIMENQDRFDARNLFEYGMHLLFESDNKECVKYGLSLLELYKTDRQSDLKEAIRTIGLSDEFSLFAFFAMLQWHDGNNEVFQLAKKIHGWGRIHALEYIEPDTEEIRKWILTEGVHNDVIPAYSALTCWQKADAETVLRNNPSREEFTGIRDIIDGLLDEGPVPGISAIQNRDEIFDLFLKTAETMELTPEDKETIRKIKSYQLKKIKA